MDFSEPKRWYDRMFLQQSQSVGAHCLIDMDTFQNDMTSINSPYDIL